MDRGQVAVEALAAAVVLVLTFVLVVIYTGSQDDKVSLIESGALAEHECKRLASAITLVESSEDSSEIIISLSMDSNISAGYINFDRYYCAVPGSMAQGMVSAGEIRVMKSNGVVTIENV